MTNLLALIAQSGFGVSFDSDSMTLICGVCGQSHTLASPSYADASAGRIAKAHRESHERLDTDGGPDWGQSYSWGS